MSSFKRNQTVEAISVTVSQGLPPGVALQTELKRLLDTDRNFGRKPRSKNPALTTYAFYSGMSPGRGSEVWFSGYEAFALLEALELMEHGWPQATTVSILRRARLALESKHAEILRWDPADLFDEQKIREAAQPGSLAVWSTRPVYLVIASRKGRPVEQSSDDTREVAVLEHDELMRFFREQPGISATMIELTRTAHALRDALVKTKPSKRGRGGS
jgi:hypothetical protein